MAAMVILGLSFTLDGAILLLLQLLYHQYLIAYPYATRSLPLSPYLVYMY
ncbi:hypothetical protein LC653_36440 [Nostoc sp. CHAB 5784]|nr:hypothetical protein [Nostoc mirabile]MCC5669189.1 hypothetical protein [Nostoc mirabile CHAB5784]